MSFISHNGQAQRAQGPVTYPKGHWNFGRFFLQVTVMGCKIIYNGCPPLVSIPKASQVADPVRALLLRNRKRKAQGRSSKWPGFWATVSTLLISPITQDSKGTSPLCNL
jgi:hypothetical protein